MSDIEAVLFDMDGVLYAYDFKNRLNLLSEALGIPAPDIKEKIFDSGWEDKSDNGDIDVDDYIAGISRRLGVDVTLRQWVSARKWAMAPEPMMLDLARRLSESLQIALLTNNGRMLLDHIDEVAPELRPVFGDRLFVSGVHGFNKERAEGFAGILDHLGWDAETTLFVDDSSRYIAAATEAGLVTHLFEGIEGLRAKLGQLGVL